jgi:L-tartrate/succinate antiporter
VALHAAKLAGPEETGADRRQAVTGEGTAVSSLSARRRVALLPLIIAVLIALVPAPRGLPQSAWYYFAIFAGVIAGLVVEPLPGAAVGLIGVTLVTTLSRWVLFSPAEVGRSGFDSGEESVKWALGGFSSSTVWLVFGAFMFALGYEKTGLGRRVALTLVRTMGGRTLALGYAIALADAVLAPFTPSNTARSAGTIFPVVRNLPPLYGSLPGEPSARRIGGYLMWTTFAAGCVTTSLFMTACAPNLLALEFIRKIVGVEITWRQWFFAAAPFAVPMLLAVPVLTYVLYPPEIKRGAEVRTWAAGELQRMGRPSGREVTLATLVLLAIVLWIFGGAYIDAAAAALVVVCLMLTARVVTWAEMAANHTAWSTLVLLATLVTLAGGLTRTGFVQWFAEGVAAHVGGYPPGATIVALVTVYFFSHYMFASLTAHTTALLPVILGVGVKLPGVPADKLALALALSTGLMGVLTPYATGAGLAYYESGYVPARDFWSLGAVFGLVFLGALFLLGLPFLTA